MVGTRRRFVWYNTVKGTARFTEAARHNTLQEGAYEKRVVSYLSAVAICAAAGAAAAIAQSPAQKAEMDKPVLDFALPNVAAGHPATVKLSDYKGKKHVVAVWMSYNCSVTRAYEERLGKLLQEYGAPKSDIAFVAVHANANETNDRIKRYAADKNFTGPVLDDKLKAPGMTEYFQARATPTVIIDKQGVLRFHGRIDNDPGDIRGEKPATKKLVAAALTSLKSGKEIAVKRLSNPG